MKHSSDPRSSPPAPDVVRWGAGCLVGGAALIGLVILAFLVAFALSPPTWVQVVLAVGLAAGATVFAWLVTSALSQAPPGDLPEQLKRSARPGDTENYVDNKQTRPNA